MAKKTTIKQWNDVFALVTQSKDKKGNTKLELRILPKEEEIKLTVKKHTFNTEITEVEINNWVEKTVSAVTV